MSRAAAPFKVRAVEGTVVVMQRAVDSYGKAVAWTQWMLHEHPTATVEIEDRINDLVFRVE